MVGWLVLGWAAWLCFLWMGEGMGGGVGMWRIGVGRVVIAKYVLCLSRLRGFWMCV